MTTISIETIRAALATVGGNDFSEANEQEGTSTLTYKVDDLTIRIVTTFNAACISDWYWNSTVRVGDDVYAVEDLGLDDATCEQLSANWYWDMLLTLANEHNEDLREANGALYSYMRECGDITEDGTLRPGLL